MKKFSSLMMSMALGVIAIAQSAPGPIPPTLLPCTGTCSPANNLVCQQNTITNFNDRQYVDNSGAGNNPTAIGATWRFYNISIDNSVPGNPVQVNATITLNSTYQAQVIDFDNNSAIDQNGAAVPNLFSPNISADQNLDISDRSGYAQFTVSFFKNTLAGVANKFDAANYTTPIPLTGLNYVHYDIDGISESNFQLRETGLVKDIVPSPVINVNATSELNAYNYSGDGSSWKGFVGSICNRGNTSDCSEVVASFKFSGAVFSVTVRMGYNYDQLSGNGLNDKPVRLYGSTFGCFDFPQQSTLPLKLLSFAGSYRNQATLLNWETEKEENFSHYDIERSSNGANFAAIGNKPGQNSPGRQQYFFTDDLSSASGTVFYYRLRLVDIDGRAKYSQVIMIRKDAAILNGLSINPNPVTTDGAITLRFSATTGSIVNLRVIDLAGKIILNQQSRVFEGVNSVSINNPGKLNPGLYVVQLDDGQTTMSARLSVIR